MSRAKWFLLFAPVLVALTLWKTEVHTNISDFFFPGDKADSRFLVGQLQSDELSKQYLISITQAPPGSEDLDEFVQSFREHLEKLASVKRVETNQINEEKLRELLTLYLPHRIHLFSLEPEHAFSEMFTSEGLESQAKIIEEALLSPDSATVKSTIAQDPMLLTLSWLTKLKQLSIQADDNAQTHASLRINTHQSGLNAAAQESFQQQLQDVFNGVNKAFSGKFSLQYTGIPVFATHIKKQVSQDIQRISSLSMVTITILFLWVFRSLKALMTTGIVLLISISAAALATQLFFGFMHGLTLALGITLVGVCVDYVIHGMVHATDKHGVERVYSFRKIWPSLLLGGITTIIGYTAISLSGFPGLQQIALFAAVGIIVTLLITRYILPELMDLFSITVQPRFNSKWLLTSVKGRAFKVLVFGLAALSIAGISQLKWSGSLNQLTPELEQLQKQDRAIRSQVASIEPGRFVLVESNNLEQALLASENVHSALSSLKNTGKLEAFYPLYPWLASQALQDRNAQAWSASLNSESRQRWSQALEKQGLASASFPPLVNSDTPPLTLEELQSSPVWPLISRQLMQNIEGGFSIAIWLGKHDPIALKDAINNVPEAHYFSQQESINTLALEYRQKASSLLVWGFIAILALLSLRFRSFPRSIQVLTPAALSVLIVLGAWGLFRTPMNMLHLIGILLTAAICVDYGIFYAENRSDNQTLTFQAITISALTSALSFACLGVAQSPALHALAWTVAPGVILGFLLCPITLKSGAKIRPS